MHLSVDVSPQTAARITAAAYRSGGDLGSVIETLAQQLPAIENGTLDQRKIATLEMLNAIIGEVPTDPEELREVNAEFEEFKQNLNANRIASGETPLFS